MATMSTFFLAPRDLTQFHEFQNNFLGGDVFRQPFSSLHSTESETISNRSLATPPKRISSSGGKKFCRSEIFSALPVPSIRSFVRAIIPFGNPIVTRRGRCFQMHYHIACSGRGRRVFNPLFSRGSKTPNRPF